MAIVENIASEIGDVIVIKASVPIVGLVTLASFTDTLINETATKFFTKEFRYTLDGINYTSWIPLTNPNIAAVPITATTVFIVEYRYIRDGADAGLPGLEFTDVQIDGTFSPTDCGDAYNNSIFAQFFTCTDVCVLSWMINVLEKLYKDGILPTYIERAEQNNDDNQDQDFLEFWKSITQYFAYIVCYARKWELTAATGNYEILIQYLRNQTLVFCGDEPIEDLIYVMNNTYDEIRHRGTFEIIKTKADDSKTVDGEWHRLFCHLGECTDWYFSSVFNYKIGWVGDEASPLWKGNYMDLNMIKSYEGTEDVVDLANYPLLNSTYVSIVSDTDNNGDAIEVMQIALVPIGETAGIGHTDTVVATSELISVSPKCDYEITFWVKMTDQDNLLSLGVNTYDINGNLLGPVGTIEAFSGADSNVMMDTVQMARGDKWYFMRGIIYGCNHCIPTEATSAHYVNQDNTKLKFRNCDDACFISPTIILDNGAEADISGTMKLYDIKVRPLNTYYSTGFEQASNFIKMKVGNYNLNYTNEETEGIIREFLIPYNSTFNMTFLNPSETTTVDDVCDVIDELDVKYTSPSTSNVASGDRYLVWDFTASSLELWQYDGSAWVSTDNSTGEIVYVTNTRNVFAYDNGKWNFSSK